MNPPTLLQSSARQTMRYAWLVVAMLWPVACLNYLDRLTITTMRDSIKAEIVMTDAQFGLLTSVFVWVYGVLSPFAGFLADRFSRSRLIIISLFVWSVVTWLTAYASTLNELLLTRALMGISEACYIPAALALITDYHRGPTRSLATGLHISGVYGGAALGGVGGLLAEHFRWQSVFSLFGIVGIAYCFWLVLALKDAPDISGQAQPNGNPREKVRLGAALAYLGRQGSFWALLSYFSLLAVANWSLYGWLPTYLGEHFKLGQGTAGLSATAYLQAASFIGILVGGVWADRWSRSNIRGRILVPVLGFCAAAPALFMSASTDFLVLAIGGIMIFGMARGFADANNMPILCQVAERRYRATGFGVMNFLSCILGGVMTYVGGALKDAHVELGLVFKGSAVGLVLAVLLLLLIKPRKELEQS